MNLGPFDREKILRILDLAKTANNQQKPDQAIALIEKIGIRSGDDGLETEWAESRLVLAEAYAAKGHQLSETLFEDVFGLLKKLSKRDPHLMIRAHEHYGGYLQQFAGRPSLAREHFEGAKAVALELRSDEDSARVQLKLELIDLTMDKSPELDNFKTFKRVAHQSGCTSTEQLAAWCHHKGQACSYDQGLRFARNRGQAGDQYFKQLLDMVRKKVG